MENEEFSHIKEVIERSTVLDLHMKPSQECPQDKWLKLHGAIDNLKSHLISSDPNSFKNTTVLSKGLN